jgi:ABC-2 type transport system permease protein
MSQFTAAVKFSFKEQLANKFALGLLVLFVPIWYWLLGAITPGTSVPFKLGPTNLLIQVNGHDLIFLTAGLNVLALILGFMFFHSAHKSLQFDKRLTRAGLGRFNFIVAKALSLAVVTAALSLYTLLILLAFWHSPHNLFVVWLGFWLVSLIYGSFGLLLGMLLNSELAGFFLVIMLSQMDVFLQVPIGNPAANKAFLKLLPSYGAVQLSTAGGFTNQLVFRELLIGGCWFVFFLIIAFGIFYIRTRCKSSLKTISTTN